jgi:catechol 2,3-dioxygenase-like lactoylglutathione lyase family enzyme
MTDVQLDHVDIRVSDFDASRRFYEAAPGAYAFPATDRDAVAALHAAALAHGGRNLGDPGPRPVHYGASVLDPDGTSGEAVLYEP